MTDTYSKPKRTVWTDAPERTLSDEQLLLEYRARAVTAVCSPRWYDVINASCTVTLRRYLGDAEMAEDAFQATFLQVHLKCEQFEEGRRFRPWLYAIATNQAIDAQRRNKRHCMVSLDRVGNSADGDEVGKLVDLLVSNDGDPFDHVTQYERGEWVRQALENCRNRCRVWYSWFTTRG